MKKLFLLSALIIFACSSDDSNDNNAETFLEKYDGVMWGNHDNGWIDDSEQVEFYAWWITFNSTGFTVWDTQDGLVINGQQTFNCYVHNAAWGEADSEGNILTIQEETEDSLTTDMLLGTGPMTWIVSPDGNFIAFIPVGESEPNWDTINIYSEDNDDPNILVRGDGVTIPPFGC